MLTGRTMREKSRKNKATCKRNGSEKNSSNVSHKRIRLERMSWNIPKKGQTNQKWEQWHSFAACDYVYICIYAVAGLHMHMQHTKSIYIWTMHEPSAFLFASFPSLSLSLYQFRQFRILFVYKSRFAKQLDTISDCWRVPITLLYIYRIDGRHFQSHQLKASFSLSLSLFNCILCVQNCLLFQLPCINSKVSVRKRTFPISTFDLVFPFIRNKNSLLVSERRKNSCRWFHMEIQLEHNVST